MATAYDPLNGLRDAQGGYGIPPKKKATYTPSGAETNRDAQGGYGPTVGTPNTGLPGSVTVPGYTPDWAKLIAGDPTLTQITSDLNAAGVGDVASRNAAINRALTQFGGVPDTTAASHALGLNLGDIVDPTTAGLAAENPYSTLANLGHAQQTGITQLKHALAAKGQLQSGELGYQLNELNHSYGQAQSDAYQKLLDALGSYQGNYASAEQARQAQLNAARGDAANRVGQEYPATGTANAVYDPATGLYKDPQGNWWTRNPDGSGSPAAPPNSGQQAGGYINPGGVNQPAPTPPAGTWVSNPSIPGGGYYSDVAAPQRRAFGTDF